MSFVIWDRVSEEGICALTAPADVEKSYQLKRGISRAEGWPADVICQMDDDFPDDIKLADNMNAGGIGVISQNIKDFLVNEKVNDVEFLPVTILNHKGRIASKDYYILNPLVVCDCIDIDGSYVDWNAIKKDMIDSCEQLVLKEDAVSIEYKVFRPKFLPIIILVRTEIAKRLREAGFTGLYFKDPLEYTGI